MRGGSEERLREGVKDITLKTHISQGGEGGVNRRVKEWMLEIYKKKKKEKKKHREELAELV